eukprot:gnl/Trimastix_PCT/1120.p1 GENE.gnl/Trimastix_PCT/1120~~gnl/Trimastix_PCT/1120.p1  ORF type:complete len:270 (+),score=65.51 gnl/Trimastix_PCT/1120:39-848(+)
MQNISQEGQELCQFWIGGSNQPSPLQNFMSPEAFREGRKQLRGLGYKPLKLIWFWRILSFFFWALCALCYCGFLACSMTGAFVGMICTAVIGCVFFGIPFLILFISESVVREGRVTNPEAINRMCDDLTQRKISFGCHRLVWKYLGAVKKKGPFGVMEKRHDMIQVCAVPTGPFVLAAAPQADGRTPGQPMLYYQIPMAAPGQYAQPVMMQPGTGAPAAQPVLVQPGMQVVPAGMPGMQMMPAQQAPMQQPPMVSSAFMAPPPYMDSKA